MSNTSLETQQSERETLSLGAIIEQQQQPVTPPADTQVPAGKAPCPECGEFYSIGAGLTRHRKMAHGIRKQSKKGTVTCPEPGCGATFQRDGLGRHLRQVHNIYGGVSGQPRPGSRGPKTKKKAQDKIDQKQLEWKHQEKSDVLLDLTAEEIVTATAEALWPEAVPTEHMGDLMTWFMQTADFLKAARNGSE